MNEQEAQMSVTERIRETERARRLMENRFEGDRLEYFLWGEPSARPILQQPMVQPEINPSPVPPQNPILPPPPKPNDFTQLEDSYFYVDKDPVDNFVTQVVWRASKTSSLAFGITAHPTFNCQIASIMNAENFLYYNNALEILKKLLSYVDKNMALFDVKAHTSKRLEEVIPSSRIMKKLPYLSARDSNMCIYLVNVYPYSKL